ncbi:3-oxoacyl-[acyl-carrier-protein] synthase III C-terminal domain-containing protein [Geitlerinema splendidum]|nr:3-oxoacyl-[acyl-carrier-protein] synthase III C-terminal domain-containing protein [Geitlerinema splendidum]
MTSCSIGIRSVAVQFPREIRTNDYWSEKYPDLAAPVASRRSRIARSAPANPSGFDIWSQEVAPYLSDRFRGNVERRVLSGAETALSLETQAIEEAIAAANLQPDDIDLAIATSLFSDTLGFGQAAKLGLRCPAWNLESTCASALVALQTARALIQTGEYRHILVVVSQMGSKAVEETDTLSWSMGDAAGAFIVSEMPANQGVLATHIISAGAASGAYAYELASDRLSIRTGDNASAIAETAVDFVRTCTQAVLDKAGVSLQEVDWFAFNTPTAWYASVCARALGIDPARTWNLYPRYANIGPVFPLANLDWAARGQKLKENDLILVYANGAGATAVATLMRWGDVALGCEPAHPLSSAAAQTTVQLAAPEPTQPAEIPNLSLEKLLATAPSEREIQLETYLLSWFASSLQKPIHQFNPQQTFATLLDSLMALMLKSRIEVDLQVQVPIEQLFGDRTIHQLAEYILTQLTLTTLTSSPLCVEERETLRL